MTLAVLIALLAKSSLIAGVGLLLARFATRRPVERVDILRGTVVMLLALPALAGGSAKKPAPEPQVSGPVMFEYYCASCHGLKGRGDGGVAPYLKGTIPDLTQLSIQNGGTYPAQRVAQVIRGEADVKTHGRREMAVWGPFFLSMNHAQEPVIQTRVANLTAYIETLQVK